MSLSYEDFRRLLQDESLPAALVDLDAVDRNLERLRAGLQGKTLRVASKSVRCVGLLRHLLEVGGGDLVGLMCFTAREAAWLAELGFDDLLVAYPTLSLRDLRALAASPAQRLSIVVDRREHLEALCGLEGRVGAVLELDVSYRRAGLHLGSRRSPLREPAQVVELASRARDLGVPIAGLMAYEGHVAGLPDANPFAPALNPVKRGLKRLFRPEVASLRAGTVRALRQAGFELPLVNGGGTGSLTSTCSEEAVTEVTAGSGFLCSHLFSWYAGTELEPAAFFACETVRSSDPGFVTCLGGGYVASGEPGWDRLPLPWLPEGLGYVQVEGAGEVQTPLQVPRGLDLELGDPVVFRHAKAGELAERFQEYLVLRQGELHHRWPTYRGMGRCFL